MVYPTYCQGVRPSSGHGCPAPSADKHSQNRPVGPRVALGAKQATPGAPSGSKQATPRGRPAVQNRPAPERRPSAQRPSAPGCRRQASLCEPWRPVILDKLELGLTAQRIYQDLVTEHGFAGKYHSVRRFVARLGHNQALPFRRMECAPGEEVQVDFGSGIPIRQPDGKRRRTHVFRIVLSHSRKGYSEVVYPADHRGLHALPGKRLLALRRRAQGRGAGQPESRRRDA